jgi:phosphatidate cytidylyltransferase
VSSGLRTRVATAAVLLPAILAAALLLPPLGWGAVALAIALAGAWEWARLCELTRQRLWIFVGGLFLMAFNLGVPALETSGRLAPDVVLAVCAAAAVFWVAVVPLWLGRRWPTRAPLLMAVVGWLVLLAAWVAMVELHARSPWLLLATMAVVWVADTAAYFAGRRFGRRKLAPAVSPGKTWEGVWGALAAVAAYAAAVAALAPGLLGLDRATPGRLAAVAGGALVVAAVSVLGDLYESWLKRQAGVKDSGRLLPGHGGVLDRVDAQLAALPLATVLLRLLEGSRG